jgi:DNA-binding transcriptional regulator YbjK
MSIDPSPKRPMAAARQKLLDAALSLIRTKGYTATTIDELCAKAGVAKGSFFHHFKEQVLRERLFFVDTGAAALAAFETVPLLPTTQHWLLSEEPLAESGYLSDVELAAKLMLFIL